MSNYFNKLTQIQKLEALGKCDFLDASEFLKGLEVLKDKKVVIIGCGSQGLNQGLNMRDSGLDISYALREVAISEKRESYKNAISNGFKVGTYAALIPSADLVINLTPDKQHSGVIQRAIPLMKKGATLSYSHGFNIVEEGMTVREDLTVILMAPKSPGSEVREEYKRGFGVPTLIAVHRENDPNGTGFEWAKAYAYATGGHRAGVLHSSFVAEVKSDLMGEQTILCGMLQSGSLLAFDKMIEQGVAPSYASQLIQYGWEAMSEELKMGGITQMLSRISDENKVKVYALSEELKIILRPLFQKHMDRIISGVFSEEMMGDWKNNDLNLLNWRAQTLETLFEKTEASEPNFSDQSYFDHGSLLLAFIKSGVELAFETMVAAGIKEESAYYESLHELPLIANTIARKKLFEMNRIISDTAEYGCYLFNQECQPLLKDFVADLDSGLMGNAFQPSGGKVTNLEHINECIQEHPVEKIGTVLRAAMAPEKQVLSHV
jgi:ketol-acid reductoisomerase